MLGGSEISLLASTSQFMAGSDTTYATATTSTCRHDGLTPRRNARTQPPLNIDTSTAGNMNTSTSCTMVERVEATLPSTPRRGKSDMKVAATNSPTTNAHSSSVTLLPKLMFNFVIAVTQSV